MKTLFSFLILIGVIVILINNVSAATNITNCQTLSSAGETYILNASISNDTIMFKYVKIYTIM